MPPKKETTNKKAAAPPKAAGPSRRGGTGRSRGPATQRAARAVEEGFKFNDDGRVLQDYSEPLRYPGKSVAPFQPPPATTPTTRTNQTFALATSSVTREEIGDIPILDVLGETVEEDEEPERLLPWKGPMRKDKTAGDHLAQIQRKIRVRKDRLEENKAKLDSLSTMGEDYQDQMEQLVEEQEDLDLQLKDLELHLQRAFRDFKGHPDSYWHSDI